MSTMQIVILSGVCVAFAVFAAVLAWGDYQTKDIRHDVDDKSSDGFGMLKKAAEAGVSSPRVLAK